MEWNRLERIVAPAYARRGPTDRQEEARRLVADAQRLAKEHSEQIDEHQVVALAWLVRLDEVRVDIPLRGAIESFFVENGWPSMKTRLLLRNLEQLPDRPQSLEEKCVADAYTIREMGLIGFVRAVSTAGAAATSLEELQSALRRRLSRRLHTPAGQRAAQKPREELRDLIDKLARSLEHPPA